MKYVSIDIETTGLDPDKDNIIEFGAVIDDLSSPKPLDTLPRFHCYILPPDGRYHGQPYALSMHPTIFKRIAKQEEPYKYYPAHFMVAMFAMFLRDNGMGDKAVMVGKNFAAFDLQFLKRIPEWNKLQVSHRTFDPTALYFKLGEDQVPPSTAKCLARAGLDSKVAHTAIEDALSVIQLMRYAILTQEPADFSSVPDEMPVKKKAPYADVPRRTRGCSVVIEAKDDGKLQPKVVPAK